MVRPDELADQVAMAGAKLLRWLRAADAEPRLSGPQASALGVIIHSDRIRMSDLARFEEVSRPAITSTAAQLQARGLIVRDADPHDGRVSWLRATEEGRRIFEEGHRRRTAPLADAVSSLSEADRSALGEASRILLALIPSGASIGTET